MRCELTAESIGASSIPSIGEVGETVGRQPIAPTTVVRPADDGPRPEADGPRQAQRMHRTPAHLDNFIYYTA